MKSKKIEKSDRRKRRVRSKVIGSQARPRLSVYRSSRFIYAQLIDDGKNVTLAAANDKKMKPKTSKIARAAEVGKELAAKARAKKITTAVFDKGAYKYHGRIKALCEGAREGGLTI